MILLLYILKLFADDMVILGKDKNDLQTSFDLIEMYFNKWGIKVNTENKL